MERGKSPPVLSSRLWSASSLSCDDDDEVEPDVSKRSKTQNHITTFLTLKVLVATIDAQWEGMGDVGSARYEPALLPPCPTIRVLSYSN